MEALSQVFFLIGAGIFLFGAAVFVFGVVTLGTGLKNKQGPDIQEGLLAVLGGAVIAIAGQWFQNVL